jgi:PKD repeat protein
VNNYAYSIDYLSQFNNMVGNLAGGTHQKTSSGAVYLRTASPNGAAEYRFGFNSDNDNFQNGLALSTALFHGNYSFVNNVQQWDGTIADRSIPNSYYLTSKPAWFGALPWPPLDPTRSTTSITNLPAGYRFFYGAGPALGPINAAPKALVSVTPSSGAAPLAVNFSSAGSLDPEGATLRFTWDFGDGSANSTIANPAHTYSAEGSYTAKLVVSDGTNSTTSSNLVIRVGNQAPVAVASATPTSGLAPLNVNFSSAGSSDFEGATLTYSWVFGDGTTSTLANPNHTYSVKGVYTARLVVSDGVKTNASPNITISASDPADSLVASYAFDEGTGNTIVDASGNGNNGTLTGGVWTNAGRFGKALSFGAGSIVTIADSASLDVTTAVTLEAWVNPSTASTSWRNVLIKTAGDPGSANPCYVLQGTTGGSGFPSAYISPASGNVVGASALPVNTWSHIAATYDGAQIKFYVNGTQVASRAQTGAITTSGDALTIGGNAFSGSNWDGLIDEVRIYNRALTQSEISADMLQPVSGAPPPIPAGLHIISAQ